MPIQLITKSYPATIKLKRFFGLKDDQFDFFRRLDEDMLFQNKITNEVIDYAKRPYKNITWNEIKDLKCLDNSATLLRLDVNRKFNYREKPDMDPILEYKDIMYDGIWQSYYDYYPMTREDFDRRAKHYQKNREIFNAYLEKAMAADPNFVKNAGDKFTDAKTCITYGAPKSLVRVTMNTLFGQEAMNKLPEIDEPINREYNRKWMTDHGIRISRF